MSEEPEVSRSLGSVIVLRRVRSCHMGNCFSATLGDMELVDHEVGARSLPSRRLGEGRAMTPAPARALVRCLADKV